VFPGTTQEVFFLERLRMEGMTIKDVEPVRVSFSEMHIALSRGDNDAYVGTEPGPGVSLSSGVGTLVEYPYSTAMGSLNMVFGTHRDVIAGRVPPREAFAQATQAIAYAARAGGCQASTATFNASPRISSTSRSFSLTNSGAVLIL